MAKRSGLNMRLLVDGLNISSDVGQINRIACPVGQLDVTGLDKSAYERIYGQRDGAIDFAPFFNPEAGAVHDVLGPLPTTDRQVAVLAVQEIGGPSAHLVAKQVNYDGTRGADGSLTFSTAAVGNGFGLEWCDLLTAGLHTSTTPESLPSLDGGAATNFGLQAYCQVTEIVGTDATVKIESSTDNSTWGDLTGGAFFAVMGYNAQRLATAPNATIPRYLRANVAGTFSSVTFSLSINRNPVAVTF